MCQRGNCDGRCVPDKAESVATCRRCGVQFWVFDDSTPTICGDCRDAGWDAADDAADQADHSNKGERE